MQWLSLSSGPLNQMKDSVNFDADKQVFIKNSFKNLIKAVKASNAIEVGLMQTSFLGVTDNC